MLNFNHSIFTSSPSPPSLSPSFLTRPPLLLTCPDKCSSSPGSDRYETPWAPNPTTSSGWSEPTNRLQGSRTSRKLKASSNLRVEVPTSASLKPVRIGLIHDIRYQMTLPELLPASITDADPSCIGLLDDAELHALFM
ncbi:hypothetical protein RRG08_009874 [Elysia crispata]|uniref:Uncharacterized protein n=1 Tax=Elysia crispata TaxID=231223 RepID=A0AAE0Z560_9GAST|nr:hypothetical protein RRG08_009874 [Elysia crispata]